MVSRLVAYSSSPHLVGDLMAKPQHRTTTHRTTTERGYGAEHQAERARWEPIVDTGQVNCWRCGCWLDPTKPWDLGHDDNDRRIYRGPECRPCNRGAAAARGNRARGLAPVARVVRL